MVDSSEEREEEEEAGEEEVPACRKCDELKAPQQLNGGEREARQDSNIVNRPLLHTLATCTRF